MTTEEEERAIEVMARAIWESLRNGRVEFPELRADIQDMFLAAARAAYAALRAHDAKTLKRVVMDEDGNVEAEKREVRN